MRFQFQIIKKRNLSLPNSVRQLGQRAAWLRTRLLISGDILIVPTTSPDKDNSIVFGLNRYDLTEVWNYPLDPECVAWSPHLVQAGRGIIFVSRANKFGEASNLIFLDALNGKTKSIYQLDANDDCFALGCNDDDEIFVITKNNKVFLLEIRGNNLKLKSVFVSETLILHRPLQTIVGSGNAFYVPLSEKRFLTQSTSLNQESQQEITGAWSVLRLPLILEKSFHTARSLNELNNIAVLPALSPTGEKGLTELPLAVSQNHSNLIATTDDGRIVSLDKESGQFQWEKKVGERIDTGPLINNEFLVLGVKISDLHYAILALNVTSGEEFWSFEIQGESDPVKQRAFRAPLEIYGDWLLCSSGHVFHVIDLKSGHLIWSYTGFEKSIYCTATASADYIYVADSSTEIALIHLGFADENSQSEPVNPEDIDSEPVSITQIPAETLQRLIDNFSHEELRVLCRELGLEYERLGSQYKVNRVREIVSYSQRNHKTYQLVEFILSSRPGLFNI